MQGGLGPQTGLDECTPSLFLFWRSYPRTERCFVTPEWTFQFKRASKIGSTERSNTYNRLPQLPQMIHCRDNFLSIFQLRKKEGSFPCPFFFFRDGGGVGLEGSV